MYAATSGEDHLGFASVSSDQILPMLCPTIIMEAAVADVCCLGNGDVERFVGCDECSWSTACLPPPVHAASRRQERVPAASTRPRPLAVTGGGCVPLLFRGTGAPASFIPAPATGCCVSPILAVTLATAGWPADVGRSPPLQVSDVLQLS